MGHTSIIIVIHDLPGLPQPRRCNLHSLPRHSGLLRIHPTMGCMIVGMLLAVSNVRAEFVAPITDPAAVNSNAASDSGDDKLPCLATDGNGNWVCVWDSKDDLGATIGGDEDILFARSVNNGATWSAVAALNSNAATDSGKDLYPSVAADGQGNWVVVWESEDDLGTTIGTDDDILWSRSVNNGVTWSAVAALNHNAATDSEKDADNQRPYVATDGAATSTWVVVWASKNDLGTNGTEGDIFFTRSTDSGATWANTTTLNSNASTDSGEDKTPAIATDGSNNWVVVWDSKDDLSSTIGGDEDILASRSTDNGATWTTVEAFNTNADSDTGKDITPFVASDQSCSWIAVWDSEDSLGSTIGTDNDILNAGFDLGLFLFEHDAGQQPDAFTNQNGETDAELFCFQLDRAEGTETITQLVFTLTNIDGLTNGDWAGVEIVVDTNGDGDIGAGETTTVGGAGVVNQGAGTITFSTSFNVSSATNYILRADFADLSIGDTVSIDLEKSNITTTACSVTGSTTTAKHIEGDCYMQHYASWAGTLNQTWQVKDLSGSPYNVPANAILEVAVQNWDTGDAREGGVREVGSSLDRIFDLHRAEHDGVDVVVMHVEADSSSQIEHYAQDITDIDFVLLGYWTCGRYVETFESFSAGADTSWEDHALDSYDVPSGSVAEIVLVNTKNDTEYEAGVRTNGSSLQRKFDIHEGDGGLDMFSLFVETDSTTNAMIEAYAESDANIDFVLVGYWRIPPSSFTEKFNDIGSPTTDAT